MLTQTTDNDLQGAGAGGIAEPSLPVSYSSMIMGQESGRRRVNSHTAGAATCHGSVGRGFTWEEACRGVGDSTGGVGVGPQPRSGWVWVVSPLIKARDPERPMAATGDW